MIIIIFYYYTKRANYHDTMNVSFGMIHNLNCLTNKISSTQNMSTCGVDEQLYMIKIVKKLIFSINVIVQTSFYMTQEKIASLLSKLNPLLDLCVYIWGWHREGSTILKTEYLQPVVAYNRTFNGHDQAFACLSYCSLVDRTEKLSGNQEISSLWKVQEKGT